jgi:RNA polymerase sigma-70 factor (ECF subfamily)
MTRQVLAADALLVHVDFVQRLARGLAGDDGDDLAQDTMVAALRSPPRHGRNPRAWLAVIAGNLLRNRARAARRRRELLALAPADVVVPSVAEIVEREEVRRRVVDAVLALPEPLRTVVLLRFYEGLDSAAIGARLGRPDSTVRTQLQSALSRLRRQLDVDRGGRAAWSPPLLAWLRALPRPVALWLRLGWPLRAMVGAVVLLVVSLCFVPTWFGGGGAPVPTPVAVPIAVEREQATPPSATTERSAVVVNASAAHSPEELWGRVVRASDGAAVAGAAVELQYCDADAFYNLDPEYQQRVETLASTRTAADGRFSFPVARARSHRLSVRAPGCAPRTEHACIGGVEIVVRVGVGASVEGVVRSAADGSPLAGVPIVIGAMGRDVVLARGESEADGSFHFADLPAGSVMVEVQPSTMVDPESKAVEMQGGQVSRVEFAVAVGRTVRGVVTDAASGLPIADGEVCRDWLFDRVVRTDADGSYELRGVGVEAMVYVRAVDHVRGYATVPRQDGNPHCDLALNRGGRVCGRFVDPAGAVLANVYAAAGVDVGLRNSMVHTEWLPAVIGNDGRFSVGGLEPNRHYQLMARARGFGMRVYVLPSRPPEDATLDLGDVVLHPAALLEGRVVDAEGRPLVGASINVFGKNDDYQRLFGGRGVVNALFHFSQRHANTAGDGSFRFADLAGGSYTLMVVPLGRSLRIESGPHVLADGAISPPITVVVDGGLSIRGIVRLADGRPLPSQHLQLTAVPTSGASRGTGVAADGSFAIERLEKGSYTLTAISPPAGFALVPVRNIAAGTKDLVVVLQPAEVIEGCVLDPAGKPVAAKLTYWYPDGLSPGAALGKTEADGRFRLEVPAGFVGRVLAQDLDIPFVQATAENVAAGARDLVLQLKDPRLK